MHPINADEFECLARKKLDSNIFEYIKGGATDELTLTTNRAAFNQIQIIPRVLKNIIDVKTDIRILDTQLPFPLMIAPSAFQALAHPEGELATVKASNISRTGMILSALSTVSLETIAQAATCPLWFQLYVYKNRSITEALIQRAESNHYQAIVVTVDTPIMGKREADIRNQLKLPKHIEPVNFKPYQVNNVSKQTGSQIKQYTDINFDKSLTWEDIAWLKSVTHLPIVLKGILHPKDAELAIKHGASAIIISNHGGRQLDSTPATINALPAIAKAVSQQIPILIDGGFRRGTDIFKAIALGANAILLGRPILWALAVDGKRGVLSLLDLLIQELIETMMLSGFSSIEAIQENGADIIYGFKAYAPILS
ncbi:alpha-hydroxy acid oxidase [Legionella oakridgensis]|uniref:alpha-hydroxy acid oxidase n=1 Tax=Legionella oakridgensis TaxID=29423 RepID=UPI0003DE1FB5|nr:alpha-hydroxy acid oxidase [Legionella oakridgensis]ETO92073.1 L-lactate dehydrogenase [Legionella oakridgensis RV-2-2007]